MNPCRSKRSTGWSGVERLRRRDTGRNSSNGCKLQEWTQLICVYKKTNFKYMTIALTFVIFTLAFAAAAEYAWWGPQRRIRMEVEQRLRGLRVGAGRRSMSLLRQQQMSGASFFSRLKLMKRLQATIDQARLSYRAGNIVAF